MPDQPPRIEQHEAWDRAGKTALRTAHDLGTALTGADEQDAEPVVVRTGGPHRSIAALAALLDAALLDNALLDDALDDDPAEAGRPATAERSAPPDRSPAPPPDPAG